jgi:hypothetical protein
VRAGTDLVAGGAVLEVDYDVDRSRLRVLLRVFLIIPVYLVAALLAMIVAFVEVFNWFALVITARMPDSTYRLTCGFLRYTIRLYAYLFLMTDAYPPWSLGEERAYPGRLLIGPRKPRYSRLKALVRAAYVVPAWHAAIVGELALAVAGFISWFVILVTGAQPRWAHNLARWGLNWMALCGLLITLTTEDYHPPLR